ncbi:MAG TPA: hypothetical protein VNM47_13995 [Terriglobia bacterium]|nr:hypothetical protein [Terriglobia bacterium]
MNKKAWNAGDFLPQHRHSSPEVVRGLTDEQLPGAAPVSLDADGRLTVQFLIEDHSLRHIRADG